LTECDSSKSPENSQMPDDAGDENALGAVVKLVMNKRCGID